MVRVYTTCTVHDACVLETRDEKRQIHHAGNPQPDSPNSPEGRRHREEATAAPRRRHRPLWAACKRYVIRRGRGLRAHGLRWEGWF
jgi:hypothetical protein